MAGDSTVTDRAETETHQSWEAFVRSRRAALIAFGWGLSEATVFFVVPDVGIGLFALFGWRAGIRAAGWALAGALVGGAITYGVGARLERERSAQLLDAVPAISMAMIGRVEQEMRAHGPAGMLLGPLRGTPYKIYARTAGVQAQPLLAVLLWSVPARGGRFVLAALLAALIGWRGERWIRPRPARLLGLYLLAWAGFYTVYFWVYGF